MTVEIPSSVNGWSMIVVIAVVITRKFDRTGTKHMTRFANAGDDTPRLTTATRFNEDELGF